MHKKLLWATLFTLALIAGACQQAPGPAELFQKAEGHRKFGQNGEAIKEYRKVIEFEPGNMKAHLGLGLSLLEEGNKADGKKSLNDAIKIGGSKDELAAAHFNLGDMALEEGDPAAALEHYAGVPAIDPQKILDTRITLVKKLLNEGDEDKGVNKLLALLAEFPNNPDVEGLLEDESTAKARSTLYSRFIAAAKEHIEKEEFNKAEAMLRKSEKVAADGMEVDDVPELWAVIRSEQGECEEARAMWDGMTAKSKNLKPKAKFYSIVCSMRTEGGALDALKGFEKIKEDDPYHDAAKARIPDALKLIETERFKVSLEKVNIRSGPSTKTKILDKWTLTREVRVIEKAGKNWYRINFNNERSAYAHKSIISNRDLAVVIKKNGWDQVKGEGWMLAFRPYVELKLANLSEKPIRSLRLRMVVRQGKNKLSDDTFKVKIPEKNPLLPDGAIIGETPATVRVELLTRPERATVTIYASINDGDFEHYREFDLNRDVVEVKDEGG